MWSNYLKVAWRNIVGNPLFSAINIIGLAIGLACCIVITVFVQYESSFDKQWNNAERTYRVTRDFFSNNLRLAAVAPVIGPLLAEQFPEIEDVTRAMAFSEVGIRVEQEQFRVDSLVMADPNIFEFFELEVLHGEVFSALDQPSNLVLTRRAAERYFGTDNPVGRRVTFMGQSEATVAGVIENLPRNTHMRFDMLLSIHVAPLLMGADTLESWANNTYYTYLRLPQNYDPDNLTARFPAFINKYQGEGRSASNALNLQRLTDIHLTSNLDHEWRENGSLATVYTFSAVAFVILLIACINFMNLTTARSTQRAKEVGVRKVVGATRAQLIFQFLGESTLLVALAMLLAVALVELALPFFAAFLELPLSFSLAHPRTLGILVLGVLGVGLVAGSYPAFYLSRFRPIAVLKGQATGGHSGWLRKGLVVFQFATSIALLIATGVVLTQMQYVRNIDLGYDKANTIVTSLPYLAPMWETYEPLKAELEAHPDIVSVVYSSRVPGMLNLDSGTYVRGDQQISDETMIGVSDIKVDYQWFDHYEVEFLAGRTFLETERRIELPSDEKPVTQGAAILNVSAARRFGWTPEQAVGQRVRELTSSGLERFIEREVVGVIPDIHFSSLHNEMKATLYAEPNPIYSRSLSIKIDARDPTAAIRHFEQAWGRLLPSTPVSWQFLDDNFAALYRSEARQAQMFGMFSAFAIFVATLGLFGLASFTTERRTKEIGIRKVMGASVRDIVLLLTRDFTTLVMLANVIAWPAAYYFMTQWLNRFVYQAPFANWAWLFLLSALAALTVAWVTIAVQASRAAAARPVMALRYE